MLLAVFFTGSVAAADSSLATLENGLSDLIYRASRSVVTVEASRAVPTDFLHGAAEEAVHRVISSGVILDSTGHILVSASTIAGCDRLIVKFEGQALPARLLGTDYRTGLALLDVGRKVGQPAPKTEQYACAGQLVITIGNAYGLRACPSLGFCAGSRPEGTMQFSAAITPGTLGGGLFDLSGHLVGVIIGGIGEHPLSEVGLAVPVHEFDALVEHILVRGDRESGYVGVTTTDIEISPGLQIRTPVQPASAGGRSYLTIERGTIITAVVPGGPAFRAGLARGDLLYRVNQRSINSAQDLMAELRSLRPGSTIDLGFIRNSQPYTVRVTVGQRNLDQITAELSDLRAPISEQELFRQVDSMKKIILDLESRLRSRKQ